MRILLVSNQGGGNNGVGNPIMHRMVNALTEDQRVDKVEFFHVTNSIKSIWQIRKKASDFDIIHIHFGGIYALIIWSFLIGLSVKKLITFHGTDIHAKAAKTAKTWKEKVKIKLNQKASFLSIRLFDKCGFVAQDLESYVPQSLKNKMDKHSFIQPLGVDYNVFKIEDKTRAQRYLKIASGKYVLFSDVSATPIKRKDIAEAIVSELGHGYKLLVMCGVKPDEVPHYINASDFVILTSDEEGSPNIIREALSLDKPFFSVNVGDASTQLAELNNSGIISRNPEEAAKQIINILQRPYTDNTRLKLKSRLDFTEISKSVVDTYENLLLS